MDKEKIVRDLLDTFDDRNELHIAYKQKMKDVLINGISEFLYFIKESNPDEDQVIEWVDNFVEQRFKPSGEYSLSLVAFKDA